MRTNAQIECSYNTWCWWSNFCVEFDGKRAFILSLSPFLSFIVSPSLRCMWVQSIDIVNCNFCPLSALLGCELINYCIDGSSHCSQDLRVSWVNCVYVFACVVRWLGNGYLYHLQCHKQLSKWTNILLHSFFFILLHTLYAKWGHDE